MFTPEPLIAQAIDKAFLSAFLLSGDISEAEDAVADTILSLDLEDLATDALLICALTLAIRRTNIDSEGGRDPQGSLLRLPVELEYVSRLPSAFRHCFVLRILLGLPKATCGRLLDIDEFDMNVAVYESVCLLALASERMKSNEI